MHTPACPVLTVLSLAPHTPHAPGKLQPVAPCDLPPPLPTPGGSRAMAHPQPILTCALTGRAGARGRAGLGAVGFEADAQDVLSRLRRSSTEDAADRGGMEEAGRDTAGRGSGLWAEGTVTSGGCCPPESPSCHPASCEGESNTEIWHRKEPVPHRTTSSRRITPQCLCLYQNLGHSPPRMAKTLVVTGFSPSGS